MRGCRMERVGGGGGHYFAAAERQKASALAAAGRQAEGKSKGALAVNETLHISPAITPPAPLLSLSF